LLIGQVSAAVGPDQLLDDWRAIGEALVGESLERARSRGVTADGVVRGDPGLRVFELILKEAADSGAELIVMGTHGRRGLQRLARGREGEMVLRDSPVPVLLVRSPAAQH